MPRKVKTKDDDADEFSPKEGGTSTMRWSEQEYALIDEFRRYQYERFGTGMKRADAIRYLVHYGLRVFRHKYSEQSEKFKDDAEPTLF